MLVEWGLRIVVPVFKGMGDIRKLLLSSEASCAWNKGGGKGIRKRSV